VHHRCQEEAKRRLGTEGGRMAKADQFGQARTVRKRSNKPQVLKELAGKMHMEGSSDWQIAVALGVSKDTA
jgi:hypothetical protein